MGTVTALLACATLDKCWRFQLAAACHALHATPCHAMPCHAHDCPKQQTSTRCLPQGPAPPLTCFSSRSRCGTCSHRALSALLTSSAWMSSSLCGNGAHLENGFRRAHQHREHGRLSMTRRGMKAHDCATHACTHLTHNGSKGLQRTMQRLHRCMHATSLWQCISESTSNQPTCSESLSRYMRSFSTAPTKSANRAAGAGAEAIESSPPQVQTACAEIRARCSPPTPHTRL